MFINDDYSAPTKKKINMLRPIFKEAKKIDPTAKFIKDKIIFRNKTYTTENIMSIGLNKDLVSQKSDDNTLVFASRFSTFSNLNPCVISMESESYNSTEQYYQFKKCLAHGDEVAAAAVKMAVEPEDAMAAGGAVRPTKEWTETHGVELMTSALREKFRATPMQVKLRATGKRDLVEATRNPLWGAGLPFTHQNILKKEAHKGLNYLGKILMKIRDEIA